MGKNINGNLQYLGLMRDAVYTLDDLAAKVEILAGRTIGRDNSPGGSASLNPPAQLSAKLKELNNHIKRYFMQLQVIHLNLRTIDRMMLTCGTSQLERAELFYTLRLITAGVITDIKTKQALLHDFIQPAHACNVAFNREYPDMNRGVEQICDEFNRTLDVVIELIFVFLKHACRECAGTGLEAERNTRRKKLFQDVSAHISQLANMRRAA